LDGFIADTKGELKFLEDKSNPVDYGFNSFYKNIDCMILGGKTYRHVLEMTKETGGYPHGEIPNYIYTRDENIKEEGNIHPISGDFENVKKLVKKLKEEGKNIWLVGGSELNYQFEKEGLIDQYIVTVVPVLLREGIPMFTPVGNTFVPLEFEKMRLLEHKIFSDGAIQNTYYRETK
jgi:dihydrofolate reductase